MKVNFNQILKDLDGNPIKDEQGKELKMSQVISNAICVSPGNSDAAKMIDLAIKIRNSNGEIDLEIDEIEHIKKTVSAGKIIALIVGQILKVIK